MTKISGKNIKAPPKLCFADITISALGYKDMARPRYIAQSGTSTMNMKATSRYTRTSTFKNSN